MMDRPLTEQLADARAERLGIIREIIESCSGVGESVNVDIIAEVLREALQELGTEPGQPKALGDEEQRAYCGISTTLTALRNLSWWMSKDMLPGRSRGHLEKLPERIAKVVDAALLPRLSMMPRAQVAVLLAEASKWAFVIWSPAEQMTMFDILEAAADGRPLHEDLREQARSFLNRYRRSMPMGSMRREDRKRANPTD